MTNPRHSLVDVVREQRRRRLQDIVVNDGLTVTQAYEAAAAFIDAQRPKEKLFPGHYTDDRGELKPTPGAIVGYDSDGKPVVSPMKHQQSRRRLVVFSAHDLAKVDGKAGLAVGRVVDVVSPEQANVPGSRKVVTEHQEKSFTFSDGSKKLCCTATGCLWGQPTGGKTKTGEPVVRKTHSDGLRVHESFVPDEEDLTDAATSEDDPTELTLAPQARAIVAGVEVDEPDDADEDTILITSAVDEAIEEVYGDSDAS
jgi:hypothetical protein